MFSHEAVEQAARRASREKVGEPRALVACPRQRGAMHGRGGGLRRAQIGRSDLHGIGAKREGCGDASAVCDPAGRDDWHAERVAHLWQKREKAGLRIRLAREEHPAMTTRLAALRNHGICAVLFQPERFGDRGRRRQDERAGLLDARQQGRRRQTEVERHDSRLRFLDDLAERLVERSAARAALDLPGIDTMLVVVERKRGSPALLRHCIGEVADRDRRS